MINILINVKRCLRKAHPGYEFSTEKYPLRLFVFEISNLLNDLQTDEGFAGFDKPPKGTGEVPSPGKDHGLKVLWSCASLCRFHTTDPRRVWPSRRFRASTTPDRHRLVSFHSEPRGNFLRLQRRADHSQID